MTSYDLFLLCFSFLLNSFTNTLYFFYFLVSIVSVCPIRTWVHEDKDHALFCSLFRPQCPENTCHIQKIIVTWINQSMSQLMNQYLFCYYNLFMPHSREHKVLWMYWFCEPREVCRQEKQWATRHIIDWSLWQTRHRCLEEGTDRNQSGR